MPNPTDWTDTSKPAAAKVEERHYAADGLDWPTGQTFQQALAASLPAALRARTLPFDAKIDIGITIKKA